MTGPERQSGPGGARRGRKPGERWRKEARNAQIRTEFHGENYAELASRWGLSARMIRYIVHGK